MRPKPAVNRASALAAAPAIISDTNNLGWIFVKKSGRLVNVHDGLRTIQTLSP
jgi:hypothetical protein